jgi:hypothetical protein
MARFLASVQGNRGDASRLGTPSSGIRAQAQGWNVGVKVYGRAEGERDVFNVYATSGSNGASGDRLIATVSRDASGSIVVVPA